jgi:hypothetical protein
VLGLKCLFWALAGILFLVHVHASPTIFGLRPTEAIAKDKKGLDEQERL